MTSSCDHEGDIVTGAAPAKLHHFAVHLLRFLAEVVRDVFLASLLVYLVLLVLDRVEKGFASYFFDLDILLWIVLATGVLSAFSGWASHAAPGAERRPYPAWSVAACAAALGILAAAAIYVAVPVSGTEALVATLAGGCLAGMLAWILASRRTRRLG